jgi:hypothetical protein
MVQVDARGWGGVDIGLVVRWRSRRHSAMTSLPVGPHRIEDMAKFCVETAQRMIEKNGAFFPWGAVIDASGERKVLTASEATPPPTAAQAHAMLERVMRARFFKGEILAGVIVAQASVPPELKPDFPDGIRLVVESSSIARLVFVPFRQSPAPTDAPAGAPAVEFGEMLGVNVQPTLFVAERTA